MDEIMKQWQLSSFGSMNLVQAEVPVPVPTSRELLIRVGAVSLNYRDKLVIEGELLPDKPRMPFVPVSDMAGEVVSVGSAVTRFRVGDRVLGNFWTQWIDGSPPREMLRHGLSLGGPLPGMLAKYVVLSEEAAVRSPDSLTDVQASTLPVAALTPWFALVESGALRARDIVLVQGTGGVALFGLQIASALGARVIVTSRSTQKLAHAKALGAFGVINTQSTPDWSSAALELTNGNGVDHVLELIGGENLNRSCEALAIGGRISQIGFLDGPDMVLPTVPMMLKRATIQGVSVGHRRAFEDMNRMIDEREIKPVIDTVYPFDEAVAAFDHLGHGAFGKIVIDVSTNNT